MNRVSENRNFGIAEIPTLAKIPTDRARLALNGNAVSAADADESLDGIGCGDDSYFDGAAEK